MIIALLLLITHCHAETVTFGEGENSFEVEFVSVGNPGNGDDPRREYFFDKKGRGSDPYLIGGVDYEYSIARFEMSCAGFKIANDLGVLSESLSDNFCNDGGSVANHPADLDPTRVGEFVNWLNTSSGYHSAYDVIESPINQGLRDWEPGDLGYNPENPTRNSSAMFFIATADEFHKAAYYDPKSEIWLDYATEGNMRPRPVQEGTSPGTAVVYRTVGELDLADVDNAGGLSAYGSMAQMGNADEWEEGFGWIP